MARKLKRPAEVETRAPVLEPLPLIGESAVFKATLERARMVAALERPVLITGPTGSGKEAIARFIYHLSGVTGAFVALNCATVPEEIAEAEFFGYLRGAFTGAQEDHIGLVGQANDGILFLDEVAELPLALQLKLLRLLQDGSYRCLGGSIELKANIRIIAATNRPLEPLVEKGLFREDLLYRLRMLRIELPPLREREDDAVFIARHILSTDRDLGARKLTLTSTACEVLTEYPWPGNVRELQSVLLEASLLVTEGSIDAIHLEATLHWKRARRDTAEMLLDVFQEDGVLSAGQLRARAGLERYQFKMQVKVLEKRGLIRTVVSGRRIRMFRKLIGSGPSMVMGDDAMSLEAQRERQILGVVKKLGNVSCRELAKSLKLSGRTINREIDKLKRSGQLRPDGKGRAVRYYGVETG